MRIWWTDEMKQEWQPPEPGDLVHLIGSTGKICGSPGLVTKTYRDNTLERNGRCSVLWENGSVETNRDASNLLVIPLAGGL
jgi:hypothetical protein